jgi:Zn-dependent protease
VGTCARSRPPTRHISPSTTSPSATSPSATSPSATSQVSTWTTTIIDARTAAVVIAGFIIAITIHEFSHAYVAFLLGDRTAQQAKRLTLNPLRHLDPFGSLLLLLTIFSGAPGIGWGRPVPVDPRRLRGGRLGMAAVSAAGPFSNVCLAIVAAVLVRYVAAGTFEQQDLTLDFLGTLIVLNVGLAVFNLLPIAPLDGFGVVVGVLPWSIASFFARLGQYGPGILLLLIFSGSIIRFDLLGMILGPPRRALLALVRQVAGV